MGIPQEKRDNRLMLLYKGLKVQMTKIYISVSSLQP